MFMFLVVVLWMIPLATFTSMMHDDHVPLPVPRHWEKVFLKVHKTKEWQRVVGGNFGVGDFLKSKETTKFLKAQYGEMKALAKDLGLLK